MGRVVWEFVVKFLHKRSCANQQLKPVKCLKSNKKKEKQDQIFILPYSSHLKNDEIFMSKRHMWISGEGVIPVQVVSQVGSSCHNDLQNYKLLYALVDGGKVHPLVLEHVATMRQPSNPQNLYFVLTKRTSSDLGNTLHAEIFQIFEVKSRY